MMCHCSIALRFIILPTAAMAATNMAPVPQPPQYQIKMMHSDDVLLLQRCQKVLGGGENSLPKQPSLRQQNRCWIWCCVFRTQSN